MLDFRVACVVAVAALTCSSIIFTVLVFMHTGFYLLTFYQRTKYFLTQVVCLFHQWYNLENLMFVQDLKCQSNIVYGTYSWNPRHTKTQSCHFFYVKINDPLLLHTNPFGPLLKVLFTPSLLRLRPGTLLKGTKAVCRRVVKNCTKLFPFFFIFYFSLAVMLPCVVWSITLEFRIFVTLS